MAVWSFSLVFRKLWTFLLFEDNNCAGVVCFYLWVVSQWQELILNRLCNSLRAEGRAMPFRWSPYEVERIFRSLVISLKMINPIQNLYRGEIKRQLGLWSASAGDPCECKLFFGDYPALSPELNPAEIAQSQLHKVAQDLFVQTLWEYVHFTPSYCETRCW